MPVWKINTGDGVLNYQVALKGGKTDVTLNLCDKDGKKIAEGSGVQVQIKITSKYLNTELVLILSAEDIKCIMDKYITAYKTDKNSWLLPVINE